MIVEYIADGRIETVDDFYGLRLFEQGRVIVVHEPEPEAGAEGGAPTEGVEADPETAPQKKPGRSRKKDPED